MAETDQAIWLHDKQASAADLRDSMQFAGLADSGGPVRPPPARPKIFFVLAADETFEIDAPDNVLRTHEVQGRKRDGDRSGPPLFGNSSFRSPYAIPARITVSQTRLGTLFLG